MAGRRVPPSCARRCTTGEDRIAAYRATPGLAQGMHAGMDAEEISHLAEDLVHARTALGNAEARAGRRPRPRGRGGAGGDRSQRGAASRPAGPDLGRNPGAAGAARSQPSGGASPCAASTPTPSARWRRRRHGSSPPPTPRCARPASASPRWSRICGRESKRRTAAPGAGGAECDAARRRGGASAASGGAGPHPANGTAGGGRIIGGARDLARPAAGHAQLPTHSAADGRSRGVRRAGRAAAGLSAGAGRQHAALRRGSARRVRPAVLRTAAGVAAPPARSSERRRVRRSQGAVALRRASAHAADGAAHRPRPPARCGGDGGAAGGRQNHRRAGPGTVCRVERRACADHGMRPAPSHIRRSDEVQCASGLGRLPAAEAHPASRRSAPTRSPAWT